jgi:hypothetical protein
VKALKLSIFSGQFITALSLLLGTVYHGIEGEEATCKKKRKRRKKNAGVDRRC